MAALKIVIDERIPALAHRLAPEANVQALPAERITPATVADADALVVRTRTRCDARLLENSRVRFIGTATIGTDHIDLAWCAGHGIKVVNAPGCNAPAVAQWVMSTIGHFLREKNYTPDRLTLGIVGVGHIGSLVSQWARHWRFRVLLNDPPRALAEGAENFTDLDTLLSQSDIITVHTPLTHNGPYPTYRLIDGRRLRLASSCALLLNAARGGIIEERALGDFRGNIAVDCWETEPVPDSGLLGRAYVATPHIAGYSLEGKLRASAHMLAELKRHFSLDVPDLPAYPDSFSPASIEEVTRSYNPMADTAKLRGNPADFEHLRNTYPLRHETHYFFRQ